MVIRAYTLNTHSYSNAYGNRVGLAGLLLVLVLVLVLCLVYLARSGGFAGNRALSKISKGSDHVRADQT